jgi:hypothetical protein
MSVYSERFLQVNIVNYKSILIKNHKKKVMLEKQFNLTYRPSNNNSSLIQEWLKRFIDKREKEIYLK